MVVRLARQMAAMPARADICWALDSRTASCARCRAGWEKRIFSYPVVRKGGTAIKRTKTSL